MYITVQYLVSDLQGAYIFGKLDFGAGYYKISVYSFRSLKLLLYATIVHLQYMIMTF